MDDWNPRRRSRDAGRRPGVLVLALAAGLLAAGAGGPSPASAADAGVLAPPAVPDAAPPADRSRQARQGTITGRVTDASTGAPLEGVRVTAVEAGRSATTDGAGRFRLADVPAGTHRLRFQALGYRETERTVGVESGETVAVEVALPVQPVGVRELTIESRRRVEAARDAPLSVTAFDRQEIDDAQIDRPKEMLQLTPGATLVRSVDSGCCAFITVRGIGQQRNTETPVATVVDDVQQFSPLQFDQPLYDVERVEVIKGPEGALYGRNAIAGAILVRTREPTPEPEGFLEVGAGKANRLEATGAYGGPVVGDDLLFRVAGHFRKQDGYFTNATLNRKVDFLRTANVRGKLRWLASERFTVDLKAQLDRTESNSLGAFTYQPAILDDEGQQLADGPFPFDFTDVDSNDVDRTPSSNNLGFDERNIEELSSRLTWEGDAASVELIGSYTSIENYREGDQFPYTGSTSRTIAGLGPVDGTQTQYKAVEGWSTELRVRSSEDQPLRWQFGGYLLMWNRFIAASVGEDRGQGIRRLEREPAFSSATNPTMSWLADDNDNEAWAVFGNLEYDLTRDLTLFGALRFDQELRDQFVSEQNTAGVPGALNQETFDKLQPKLRIGYTPGVTGDVLSFLNLYGSWGLGFRSGQFNQNGVGEAAAAAGVEGVRDVVEQEEASTFEAGFKTRWFDNRVSWESAFYRTDDEGQPFFIFIGQVGAQVLVNIPEATIRGFESTLRAQVTEGLDAYVAGAVTDTEIEAFPVDPTAVGGKIPLVPEYTLNLGAQYRHAFTEDVAMVSRVDYERLGEMAWTAANTTPRDPVGLLTLGGGLEVAGWKARFEVENATDEVYNSEFVAGGFAWPAPPVRWRVTLETGF
jgi:iron complex outermembrane receptor protein